MAKRKHQVSTEKAHTPKQETPATAAPLVSTQQTLSPLDVLNQAIDDLAQRYELAQTHIDERGQQVRLLDGWREMRVFTRQELERMCTNAANALERARSEAELAYGLSSESSMLAELQTCQANYDRCQKERTNQLAQLAKLDVEEQEQMVHLQEEIQQLHGELALIGNEQARVRAEKQALINEQANALIVGVETLEAAARSARSAAFESQVKVDQERERVRGLLSGQHLGSFNGMFPQEQPSNRLIKSCIAFLDALIVDAPHIGVDLLYTLNLNMDELRDVATGSPEHNVQQKRVQLLHMINPKG